MKRLFYSILFLMALLPSANAALPVLPGFTGRVGSGDAFYIRLGYGRSAGEVGKWYNDGHDNGYTYTGLMSQYYRDYCSEVFSRGTFSLEGGYNWQGRFGFGLNMSFTPVAARWKNSITGEGVRTDRGRVFSIYPEARYYYICNDALRLYSSVGVGASFLKGFGDKKAKAIWQLSLAGIEFGDRLFGFAEFGFGDVYDFLRAGVGYRF